MSEISDAIQAKCLAFGDRIIKLNDYLLAQAVAAHENYKKSKIPRMLDACCSAVARWLHGRCAIGAGRLCEG